MTWATSAVEKKHATSPGPSHPKRNKKKSSSSMADLILLDYKEEEEENDKTLHIRYGKGKSPLRLEPFVTSSNQRGDFRTKLLN